MHMSHNITNSLSNNIITEIFRVKIDVKMTLKYISTYMLD